MDQDWEEQWLSYDRRGLLPIGSVCFKASREGRLSYDGSGQPPINKVQINADRARRPSWLEELEAAGSSPPPTYLPLLQSTRTAAQEPDAVDLGLEKSGG